jgi:hypothetical protein
LVTFSMFFPVCEKRCSRGGFWRSFCLRSPT